ncbi:hypothetical protein ADL00_00520 [Streptomyces sp. AS58]|nr:hypothetical protein ADL00_00520 [Streptomyces sp. AS58]
MTMHSARHVTRDTPVKTFVMSDTGRALLDGQGRWPHGRRSSGGWTHVAPGRAPTFAWPPFFGEAQTSTAPDAAFRATGRPAVAPSP